MHSQSWETLKIIPSLKAHSSVRAVSIRGRACGNRACAAARPLGKFGGRGGVRRRAGMQSRGARGVGGVGGGGLACHWPRAREEKESFCVYYKKSKSELSLLLDNIRLRAHDIHTNHNLTF